ncbi:MAG: FeoA family protein [Spirochaetia bacterium]
MKLKQLLPHQEARIISYTMEEGDYFHRLLSLGLTIGECICIKRKALWGGPMQIIVRGTSLALRACEADLLNVEVVTKKYPQEKQ